MERLITVCVILLHANQGLTSDESRDFLGFKPLTVVLEDFYLDYVEGRKSDLTSWIEEDTVTDIERIGFRLSEQLRSYPDIFTGSTDYRDFINKKDILIEKSQLVLDNFKRVFTGHFGSGHSYDLNDFSAMPGFYMNHDDTNPLKIIHEILKIRTSETGFSASSSFFKRYEDFHDVCNSQVSASQSITRLFQFLQLISAEFYATEAIRRSMLEKLRSFYPYDEISTTVHVFVADGFAAELPCNWTSPDGFQDRVQLIRWSKGDTYEPLYVFDARKNSHLETIGNWTKIGSRDHRISFYSDKQESIGRLKIEEVTKADRGFYRCQVIFSESPTRNSNIKLQVIEFPNELEGLAYVEQLLISWVRPDMQVDRINSCGLPGQYAHNGNIINISQDITEIASLLPGSPSTLDTIIVRYDATNRSHNSKPNDWTNIGSLNNKTSFYLDNKRGWGRLGIPSVTLADEGTYSCRINSTTANVEPNTRETEYHLYIIEKSPYKSLQLAKDSMRFSGAWEIATAYEDTINAYRIYLPAVSRALYACPSRGNALSMSTSRRIVSFKGTYIEKCFKSNGTVFTPKLMACSGIKKLSVDENTSCAHVEGGRICFKGRICDGGMRCEYLREERRVQFKMGIDEMYTDPSLKNASYCNEFHHLKNRTINVPNDINPILCEPCSCTCEEENFYYFTTGIISTLIQNDMVVTGSKLEVINKTLVLRVQQGKLLPNGQVDQKSLSWLPPDLLEKERISSFETDGMDLTRVVIPPGRVMTGLGLWKEPITRNGFRSHIKLWAFSYEYNFTTGRLGGDLVSHFATNADQRLSLSPESLTNKMNSQFDPMYRDKYVKFTSSEGRNDRRTSVSFIDAQEVVSNISTPMSGAGLYFRKQMSYGGIVGIELLTYDTTPFLLNEPNAV